MSTGSNRFQDLEEVGVLDSQDQFIFFQNSSKKAKKVSRQNLVGSTGFGTSIPGVVQEDLSPPATPTGLSLTTRSEIDSDGSEKIFITAKITPNTEEDLSRYGWYIRRVTGTPQFNGGGVLTGYTAGQIYEASLEESQSAGSVGTDGKVTKEWTGLKPNTWYQIRVCAIDAQGNASAYTAENSAGFIQTAKDSTPPAAPTSVTITSAIKSIFLNWTNSTDDDWAFVRIYRNTSNTPPTIGTTAPHASIAASSFVDENLTQGTTYYYWLTSVDTSDNETATTSTVVSDSPGTVAATDISNFAVTATKLYANVIVLSGDSWTDNSPSGGSIAWNSHTLVYGGASYTISAGSTSNTYVYWTGGTTYQTSSTNPALADGHFMIATNTSGAHDLAWNALANAVIGSAYIQNAAITNAKIFEMTADKIRTATLSAQTITLAGSAVIKSDGVTNSSSGNGFYLEGISGSSILGIGDLSETNAFLKWSTSAATLKIKGELRASSGWFGTSSTNGVIIDSNGLEIKGTGVADAVGRIKANIDWGGAAFTPTMTSGFYLGRAANQYRFFIGNTGSDGVGAGASSLYWSGTSLTVTGVIQASSGYFGTDTNVVSIGSGGLTIGNTGRINSTGVTYTTSGFSGTGFYLGYAGATYQFFIGNPSGNSLIWDGTNLSIKGKLLSGTVVGASGDGSQSGLVITSPTGIRRDNDSGILTITGGQDNGSTHGAQIDLCGNSSGVGNRGVLVLQAGQGNDSAITMLTNQSPTTDKGVIRVLINTYGLVQISRNQSAGGSYTQDSGNLQVMGNIGINKTPQNTNTGVGQIDASGDINSDADMSAVSFNTSSTKRVKKNIKKYNTGLKAVKKLNPVSFKRKRDSQNDIGFIAEEVNEILPLIVRKDDKNLPQSLDYSKITVVLVNAIKELSIELERLKNKIK